MDNQQNQILKLLDGIDKTESEYENGWWETSAGAEFGASKLKELTELLFQPTEPVAWVCDLLGDIQTNKPADNNGYTPLYKH